MRNNNSYDRMIRLRITFSYLIRLTKGNMIFEAFNNIVALKNDQLIIDGFFLGFLKIFFIRVFF